MDYHYSIVKDSNVDFTVYYTVITTKVDVLNYAHQWKWVFNKDWDLLFFRSQTLILCFLSQADTIITSFS